MPTSKKPRVHIRIPRRAFEDMWNNPACTTDHIAAAFGIHRSTVTPTGQRFGLPPRKPGNKGKPLHPLFRAMWLAGVSSGEIAEVCGMARTYVYWRAMDEGLPTRGHGFRARMTLAAFLEVRARLAMEVTAAADKAALRDAEMVDTVRRRAA